MEEDFKVLSNNNPLRKVSREKLAIGLTLITVLTFVWYAQTYYQKRGDTRTNASCVVKFADITCDNPLYQATYTLGNKICGSIINGEANSSFMPVQKINRAAAIAMITRYHVFVRGDWTLRTPLRSYFTDVAKTDPWYSEIETAIFYGFTSGYGDRSFKPYDDWLYGFSGVDRSDYRFGTPEQAILRGEFATKMYQYGLSNNFAKITSCQAQMIGSPVITSTPNSAVRPITPNSIPSTRSDLLK